MQEKYYYANQGFYLQSIINTAYANGLTDEDLTEISEEDYNLFFNPPEGKYGTWVDGKPVVIDLPPPDYVLIAERQREKYRDDAYKATYTYNLKLAAGRKLTTDETTKLNAWLDYSDELEALDLSTAPDIEWPTQPN